MKRRDLCGLVIAGAAIMAGGPAMATETLASKADKTLNAWVDAWNREDLDAMFALFVPEAHLSLIHI